MSTAARLVLEDDRGPFTPGSANWGLFLESGRGSPTEDATFDSLDVLAGVEVPFLGVEDCGADDPVDAARLFQKEEKIPFFSGASALTSSDWGSSFFHPAGVSSCGASILFLTDSSQADEPLATNSWDIGLSLTIGRFLDILRLPAMDFTTCVLPNWMGG